MSDDEVEQATTFNSNHAPEGERLDGSESFYDYYDRLSLWNRLDWNGKWRNEKTETRRNAVAIVDAIAGQLQLTDFQKERTKRQFAALPSSLNESYSTALLALCVSGHVGRADGRKYHPEHIKEASAVENDFTRLLDEVGVSQSELWSCWRRVSAEMDL